MLFAVDIDATISAGLDECPDDVAECPIDLLTRFKIIPGAVAGVQRLSQSGRIIYVTCRRPEQREATQIWLRDCGFPSPDQVYVCERYYSKFLHAYTVAHAHEQIVLIDDLANTIIRSFVVLHYDHRAIASDLVPRLFVAGFGCKTVESKFAISCDILSSWQTIDTLLRRVQDDRRGKEETRRRTKTRATGEARCP